MLRFDAFEDKTTKKLEYNEKYFAGSLKSKTRFEYEPISSSIALYEKERDVLFLARSLLTQKI